MKKNTACLMIQGATSDAGKSAIVTGLCRLFQRRGIKVAPFKPQNMALNSAVTVDGGEIGRAQALQAQACGLEPHTDMNPILLKPNTDIGAQVIIQGKVQANMDAYSYHDFKKTAMQWVLESYYRLAQQYDLIIVEGAGSPAEINLRDHDIANMGFAEAVDCPVIIIADIDRGGVFAHLYGTLALLSESEQQRVKGFIINKFRGDVELLLPGNHWLEEKTQKPVLATLPYLHHLHLEAEDAIALKAPKPLPSSITDDSDTVIIVVPVLSRISNHTDFDPLHMHPQVELKFVALDQTIPPSDLIILPGSKSVRDDIKLLKQHGWAEHIAKHLRYGGKLLGICGGYQMLGKIISDPKGIEGPPGSQEGFGYLSCQTVLCREKQLTNVTGKFKNSEIRLQGYEIHVGITTRLEDNHFDNDLIVLDNGERDGLISADNQVIGCYLHGIFELPEACQHLLEWVGLNQVETVDHDHYREQAIDLIADTLESEISMEKLIEITGLSESS